MKQFLAKICGVEAYMRALRTVNEQQNTEIAKLLNDKESLQKENFIIKTNEQRLYTARQKAEQERDKWIQDYNTVAGRCNELEETNETLSENLNKYQDAVSDLSNRLTALTRQFDELGKAKAQLEIDYRDSCAALTKRNYSLMGTVRQLKKKLEEKKA